MTYLDLAGLGASFRAVADSFGVREAVRVTSRVIADTGLAASPDSLLAAITEADIVVDDMRGLRRWLRPDTASWYVQFATDGVVIAYRDSLPPKLAVDSTNWWTTIQGRNARTVRANPDSDATGRLALVVMQLAERHYHQRDLASKLLGERKKSPMPGSTEAALALVRADSADFAWARETEAASSALPLLRLPPEIDLSDPAHASLYGATRVAIPRAGSRDSTILNGAPLLFVVSSPVNAANRAVAARFIRFLVSDDGRRMLDKGHLRPPKTTIAIGSGIPSLVAASVDSVIALPDSLITAAPESAASHDTAHLRP